MYEEKEAIAAGGKLLPKWETQKPKFLPEEYYWLVGATHKGFSLKKGDVRDGVFDRRGRKVDRRYPKI